MATLAQFSRNIRKRGSQLENSATRIVKQSSKAALRSLVYGTKVDKGVARSNWRVGIGAPTRSVIPAYAPYPKGSKANGAGMLESANASAAIAAGSARIYAVSGVRGLGLTTAIYISNNIPYPNQAFPTGMVATALIQASASIKGFRVFSR